MEVNQRASAIGISKFSMVTAKLNVFYVTLWCFLFAGEFGLDHSLCAQLCIRTVWGSEKNLVVRDLYDRSFVKDMMFHSTWYLSSCNARWGFILKPYLRCKCSRQLYNKSICPLCDDRECVLSLFWIHMFFSSYSHFLWAPLFGVMLGKEITMESTSFFFNLNLSN